MDREQRIGQRSLPLARADDEVGPARHRPRARGEGRKGLIERGRGDERPRHACVTSPRATRHTRSGVMGNRRPAGRARLVIALATAPAVGTHGGSPTPFEPLGPAFGVSISIHSIVHARGVGTS